MNQAWGGEVFPSKVADRQSGVVEVMKDVGCDVSMAGEGVMFKAHETVCFMLNELRDLLQCGLMCMKMGRV